MKVKRVTQHFKAYRGRMGGGPKKKKKKGGLWGLGDDALGERGGEGEMSLENNCPCPGWLSTRCGEAKIFGGDEKRNKNNAGSTNFKRKTRVGRRKGPSVLASGGGVRP